ncbi:MAG: pentapeptide repeat-containing protein [Spirochaetota bacterium]
MFKPGTTPSRPVTAERLQSLLARFNVVFDLNMQGLELGAIEVADNAFYGCNFADSSFVGGTVRGCTFEMCFFPTSKIERVEFVDVRMKNCVFGASRFDSVTFRGSTVIQCNFNGVHASDLVFDDCDLLHTRFNAAVLRSATFDNCNLKETRFLRTDTQDVSFRLANPEDAVFAVEDSW